MKTVRSLFLFRNLSTVRLVIGACLFIALLVGGAVVVRVRLVSKPLLVRGEKGTASVSQEDRMAAGLAELPDHAVPLPETAGEIRAEMKRLADWLRRWLPDAPDAGIVAGRLEYHLGAMDAAEETFQNVLRLSPNHVHAHHGLALIDVARSRFKEAIPHFQRVIALSAGATGPMLELADALIRDGRIDEAVDLLENDFPSGLESVWRYQMLGQCYLHRGDLRRARIVYESALAIQRDDAASLAGLVTVFSRLGDREQAAKYTEQLRQVREKEREVAKKVRREHDDALALSEKLADAYATAGHFCEVREEPALAQRLLRRAVRLCPSLWQPHYDLAKLYLKLGDRIEEAVAHAEAAAKVAPGPVTQILLARGYQAAGRSVKSTAAQGAARPVGHVPSTLPGTDHRGPDGGNRTTASLSSPDSSTDPAEQR